MVKIDFSEHMQMHRIKQFDLIYFYYLWSGNFSGLNCFHLNMFKGNSVMHINLFDM